MLQDNLILEHYGLNELNFDTIKSYRDRFAEVKPAHPWNALETKEFLYKVGAWGKVRDTHKEGVTLAGLLLFSEERIITEVLPQYFLEYRESKGNEEWTERFTSQDGTWSGNIFDFYFHIHEIVRNSEPQPSIASSLTEVLINMLIHADYNGEGGVILEKQPSYYVFSNPGLLLVPSDSVFSNTVSQLRNPNIVKLFSLLGLCERSGSGLKKVKQNWSLHHYKTPAIDQDASMHRTVVTLSLSTQERQVSSSEKDTYNTSITGSGNNFKGVEKYQNTPKNNVEINSYNKNDNSYNKGDEELIEELESYNNDENSCNKGENCYNSGYNPYNKEVDSYNNIYNSYNKEPKDDLSNSVNVEDIDTKLWDIAALAREKKRLSPNQMEHIILELCKEKPLMLKEFAYLLERTPDGVRNNYLTKLLRKGQLQLKYPNQPNHPKQAYLFNKKEIEK
ncbi:transcriptional regulator [Priestia aryabhattai]|uniref:ATP-binding protein n=1 Tax=Priestia aryabhattai TaxID=412384 RepID=UPI00203E7BF5|nr:ATP-binding protein [Priestia aryabhattai]MCM3773392.1 transcriptional regulator [Priestia aryabhattai]